MIDDYVILKNVAANIRAERARANLSQEELAHRAGINRSYLGEIERGDQNPSLLKLCAIADALRVEPTALVRGALTPPPMTF